jgi:hypothetical protein
VDLFPTLFPGVSVPNSPPPPPPDMEGRPALGLCARLCF